MKITSKELEKNKFKGIEGGWGWGDVRIQRSERLMVWPIVLMREGVGREQVVGGRGWIVGGRGVHEVGGGGGGGGEW